MQWAEMDICTQYIFTHLRARAYMFISYFYNENFLKIYFSKINRDNLNDSISAILQASQDKPRKFTQSVELQIVLKNYDPQKDRRFAGTVR